MDHTGDLAHLLPFDTRHRIEIDTQLVGMIEVLGADGMRMQLEAGEVGHPRERGRRARHDLFRSTAGRETSARPLQSSRAAIPARASDRRTRRRCRWGSARARSAGHRPRAARPLRPPGNSGRRRAWYSPPPGTALSWVRDRHVDAIDLNDLRRDLGRHDKNSTGPPSQSAGTSRKRPRRLDVLLLGKWTSFSR